MTICGNMFFFRDPIASRGHVITIRNGRERRRKMDSRQLSFSEFSPVEGMRKGDVAKREMKDDIPLVRRWILVTAPRYPFNAMIAIPREVRN